MVGSPSVEELRDEQRRLRYVQFIVDLTTNVIMQSEMTRREAEDLVASARERILQLFPGREETYEILYARRFARVVETCTRPEPPGVRGRILPFARRDS
jgi:hypothetical protein